MENNNFTKKDMRIKKICFKNHEILGDLELDFCGRDGKPVSTIIIAGENGTGKSTLIGYLYELLSRTMISKEIGCKILFNNIKIDKDIEVTYSNTQNGAVLLTGIENKRSILTNNDTKNIYPTNAIYSDVAINFNSQPIKIVTSLEVDVKEESRRSNDNLSNEIKQLLIDIRQMDSEDFSNSYDNAIANNNDTKNLDEFKDIRIKRFKSAFGFMFDDLEFSRIVNENDAKDIIFTKNGKDISIDSLSTGEKQIVFRNSFLLKDKNVLEGAFVFIDEPEISLHPNWQKKVLENYKRIFINEQNEQTSQIFVVTHSPFIIHNEYRYDDKVIILKRNDKGKIVVSSKLEYYDCNSVKVIEDAFNILDLSKEQPTVYLEGETDEKYFNKALEVYKLQVPFIFKQVGYKDKNGQVKNGGEPNLLKAFKFLSSRNSSIKNICLFDCDVKHKPQNQNNTHIIIMTQYESSKDILIGIENALCFGDININEFISSKEVKNNYGLTNSFEELNKNNLCDHICSLHNDKLQEVFANLKLEIEKLIKIFDDANNSII